MTRFEYRSIVAPATKLGADLATANELGADGWEAFAAVPAAMDGYAYQEVDGLIVLLRRAIT